PLRGLFLKNEQCRLESPGINFTFRNNLEYRVLFQAATQQPLFGCQKNRKPRNAEHTLDFAYDLRIKLLILLVGPRSAAIGKIGSNGCKGGITQRKLRRIPPDEDHRLG